MNNQIGYFKSNENIIKVNEYRNVEGDKTEIILTAFDKGLVVKYSIITIETEKLEKAYKFMINQAIQILKEEIMHMFKFEDCEFIREA